MKLAFKKPDGSSFQCNIGYSLLTHAADYLKKQRHLAFRATIETIASCGASVDSKESVLMALEEHIRTQVPSDKEVKQWLLTLEGQKFSLIHGTRNYPEKLNEDSASIAMDEMDEKMANDLADAIGSLCFGAEMSIINRESSMELIKMARLELEKLKEQVEEAGKDEPQEESVAEQELAGAE